MTPEERELVRFALIAKQKEAVANKDRYEPHMYKWLIAKYQDLIEKFKEGRI